jgi:leader peptidase (prepilin peptidase) / N-methyltransferase
LSAALPAVAGAALVAAGAAVAGLGPRRLLADLGQPVRTAASTTGAAAIMGLGVYAMGLAAGFPALGAGLGLLAAVLVVVFVVDLRTLTIPDLTVLMIATLAVIGPIRSDLSTAVLGALVGGGLLWLVRWAFQRRRGVIALGFGDVKLLAAIGALAGPQLVLWIVVITAVLGIGWAMMRGARLDAGMIPFGAAAAAPAFAMIGWDRLAG